ncbi:MAG TPA: DUF429 domain-containing protein [Candidatus Methanoperedens sp.]
MTIYIGVDLGTSLLRKSTGLACLVEKHGKPTMESPPVHIISEDELIRKCITQMSEHFQQRLIAMDAPLSRPEHGTMRECEKRLRKRGIACFPSGADWVTGWVDKAIGLKAWAKKELSARMIEVYPYAARRALDMGTDVKKKTKEGRHEIQEGLLKLIWGLDELTGDKLLSDDELDAILSAYTAYLKEKGDADSVDGTDGVIFLPLRRQDHKIYEY